MYNIYMEKLHYPVLLSEVLAILAPRPKDTYLDLTAGYAGHAREILDVTRQYKDSVLVDRDEFAVEYLREEFGSKIEIKHEDFYNAVLQLIECGKTFDIILADFGVSSPQLDREERGFSFRNDGPLDMRMDKTQKLSAYEVVNTYDKERLEQIFRLYGEERYAGRIAEGIVRDRKQEPFDSTLKLAGKIASYMPAKARNEDQHPARRCFQAIRIEVNGELDSVRTLLREGPKRLSDGGRMAVISFHSLEDRIVKEEFRTLQDPCICPKDLPRCVCGRKSMGKVITRKPVTATEEELKRNNRSHSAKLRIFERVK